MKCITRFFLYYKAAMKSYQSSKKHPGHTGKKKRAAGSSDAVFFNEPGSVGLQIDTDADVSTGRLF